MKLFRILKKSRIGSALLTFAVGMGAMTVIARTADSFMLPQVTVGGLKAMSLIYPVTVSGRISSQGISAVYGEEGLRVGSVETVTGDVVEAGDVLFIYDMAFLDKKIKEKKKELQKISIQLEAAKSNKVLGQSKKSRSISRAKTDYNDTLYAAGFQEKEAYREMEAARRKLEDTANNPPASAVQNPAMQGTEDIFTDSTERFGDGSGNDTQGEDTDGSTTAPEDPQALWQAEIEALQQDYQQKKRAYQETLNNTRESKKSARRQVEDAAEPSEKDSSIELQELELTELQESLEKLSEVKERGGKICSNVNGKIKNISVEIGGISGTEAAVLIEDYSQEFFFEGLTDEKNAEVLNTGDVCKLYRKDNGKYIENQKIDSITEVEEDSYKVTVPIISDLAVQSGSAELILEAESRFYDKCVPLTALYENGEESYVFAVEEKAAILGMETIASRIPVRVIEKNDSCAAVEGSFGMEVKLIMEAGKNINDGERVRVTD